MDVKGFVPTSLVDWDGRISSVIFLPGCNFRCPWCYARDLVLEPEKLATITLEKLRKELEHRKRWIDGVVVCGGEPAMNEDLPELCAEIKKLGFPVKIDTNGTNPAMLSKLIKEKLVDYVAMDVKAPLNEEKYGKLNGGKDLLDKVKESIKILMTSGVEYEFRTTLVPGLHSVEDVEEIAFYIKGAKKYALQNFVVPHEKGKLIDEKFSSTTPFDGTQMKEFRDAAKKFVDNIVLRG
jgi:pyruvate formate lyase activating enzyme